MLINGAKRKSNGNKTKIKKYSKLKEKYDDVDHINVISLLI
jgi:hypothetical protein